MLHGLPDGPRTASRGYLRAEGFWHGYVNAIGFRTQLAAEHWPEGLPVSRETLRKWMTAAFCAAQPAVKKIHVWRQRRGSFGELVMQDSSRSVGWRTAAQLVN